MDKLLVVEFSDFLLWVKFDAIIGIPFFAVNLSEKFPLLLAFLWLWEFLSLNEVEWESKKLLSVRCFKFFALATKILDSSLIGLKSVISLLKSLLE